MEKVLFDVDQESVCSSIIIFPIAHTENSQQHEASNIIINNKILFT